MNVRYIIQYHIREIFKPIRGWEIFSEGVRYKK